ncbi:hypothetical protein OCL06_07310 [Alteromonas sp. ASW11-19]|uniref:Uncharacterized protein n=1 Tax=Alteromonas salexigens TaxID=2982530 RepID=A0ABT2VNF7_9ALTE|nr:hypothetical protein [Alteromonas salexigens]MCU7554402.1 hypothetical protein [Alteromonas salexigens]
MATYILHPMYGCLIYAGWLRNHTLIREDTTTTYLQDEPMNIIKILAFLLLATGLLIFHALYFKTKPLADAVLLVMNTGLGALVGGFAVHLYYHYKRVKQ